MRANCEHAPMSATSTPTRRDLASRLRDPELLRTDLFVAGDWTESGDGARFDVLDPADRSLVATVASATRDDVRRAIDAAGAALPAWAALTAKERAATLRRWFD